MERALDLVDRLNLEMSFELAMDLADHDRTLVDRIQNRKDIKFGGHFDDDDDEEEEEEDYYESPEDSAPTLNRPRISPDSTAVQMNRKRQLVDDGQASRRFRPKESILH